MKRPQFFKDDGTPTLLLLTLAWFFGGAMLGALNAAGERSNGGAGCIYRSVGSFTNPWYIVGCELFLKRFEIGK